MLAVGISMPNTQQARWTRDGSYLAEALRKGGYHADLHNADDDVLSQITQIRAMINAGDRALVIAPISGAALGPVLAEAATRHVPVIAYDRLIRRTRNVDYYVSFDNRQVGVEQARSLLQGLGYPDKPGPFTMEMFGGSPDDGNSFDLYEGALSVLRPLIASRILVIVSGQIGMEEISTARWSADAAHARLDNLLVGYYAGRNLDGVLASNDEIASGVIASLRSRGYGSPGRRMPIITGQDCEIGAARAILSGYQYSSVFKDTRALASATTAMLRSLLTGKIPMVNDPKGLDNDARYVPTLLLAPMAVNRANLRHVLIDSGYYPSGSLD